MDRQQLPRPSPSPTVAESRRSAAEAMRQAQQKALARGRVDRAFQFRIDGNHGEARQALAEAVRIDPDLITDSTVISLAETLINQPLDKVVMQLLEYSQNTVIKSRPSFKLSWQGGLLIAACLFLAGAAVSLSTAFYTAIAPFANQLLTRAGIQAVNAARLDSTLQPMAAAPLWPIIDTAIVLTVTIMFSVVGSYIICHWLGGAGSVSRYMIWLLCPYAAMFLAMTAALMLINKAGRLPPPSNSFDGTFTAGVWLLEAALPVTLVINSVIAGRVHAIKWIRSGAAIMVCTLILVVLFGILAGFTLIPKL